MSKIVTKKLKGKIHMAIKSKTTKAKIGKEPAAPQSVEFLLTQFMELGEYWRHTDTRIEATLNFYSTTSAVIVSALVVFYQASYENLRIFIFSELLINVVLFLLGLFLIRRITIANFRKSEYLLSIQLIRQYFIDHDPTMVKYLYLSSAQPSENHKDKANQLNPYFHRQIILTVIVINSILTGVSICEVLWLTRFFPFYMTLGVIGLSASAISFFILKKTHQNNIAQHKLQ